MRAGMPASMAGTLSNGVSVLVARVRQPRLPRPEDGYDFADPPSTEDFQAQLERSILELEEAGERVLFDRCPADLLAYLLVGDHEINPPLQRCREAIGLLDLVVARLRVWA